MPPALKRFSTSLVISRTFFRAKHDNRTQNMPSGDDFIAIAEDMDVNGPGSRRGGRGKAGGRGGCGGKGGGGGQGEMNREVTVSKALSKLLRHAAVDAGLKLDAEGFARLDQVVSVNIYLLCFSRR